jgi:hypothetical protein
MSVVGGSFFSLLSGFPLRETFQRRDRIDAMLVVIEQLNSAEPVQVAGAEQQVTKMLERILGG